MKHMCLSPQHPTCQQRETPWWKNQVPHGATEALLVMETFK